MDRVESLGVTGESSWAVEWSFSCGDVSPTHDDACIASIHAPDADVHVHDPPPVVEHATVVPGDFFGGSDDTLLLPRWCIYF